MLIEHETNRHVQMMQSFKQDVYNVQVLHVLIYQTSVLNNSSHVIFKKWKRESQDIAEL